MKQLLFIISFGFRLLIFSLVFGSIILQPMLDSLYCSERHAFSWLDLDTENDSNKNESQETKEFKESKNKKVELQFINEEETMFKLVKKASIFGLDFSKMEVTIDTNDPPPELI
jgi:hypothetical protein